jgi:hypothetical protein
MTRTLPNLRLPPPPPPPYPPPCPRQNALGADGAVLLASAIKANRSLRHLEVSENPLGADGVRALARALPYNNTLTTLGLASVMMCDQVRGLAVGFSRWV